MDLMEFFEIDVQKVEDSIVIAKMPIKEKHTQKYGYLHGGASIVLAETLAGIGSSYLIGENKVAAGIKVNSQHIKAKKLGNYVIAIAKLDKKSNKNHIWNIKIYDENYFIINLSKVECKIVDKSLFK